ncbi:hypothetical protein FPZ42_15425 [Mucilaginibacter achroorhodeus]|uniref:Uncharacterized protein n=1 Tax=Mucilaginibacter achroorhodeus TaxID=2599294 RepID=A0A563U0W2_9SPHI|nr:MULTISPECIES: hypothetical protein [Mucilaginibacter]QXV65399.1 hypothetical protein INP83_20390 [Mucilaginibacter sp. 21P]TWR24491.1 hypothetical protein FPZ42_15425 [Mucilaginibacter achroorhodeus]
MAIDNIIEKNGDEKEWDNPGEPEKTSDSRDEEQVERQHREAKRRHDNLTENQDEEEDKNKDK